MGQLHDEADETHSDDAHTGGAAGGNELLLGGLSALLNEKFRVLGELNQGDDDGFIDITHVAVFV